jgi:hypothetical protein
MARNRYNFSRAKHEKPKKFIVVATEGRKTERIYLDQFKPARDSSVQLKVLPNKNDKTHPKEVLQRLKDYAKTNYVGPDDELWLMIDRDSWDEAELNEMAAEAAKCGFKMALSNPCIEYWFYLHFRDSKPFNHRHQLLPEMEKLLGSYGKGNYDAAKIAKEVEAAIARAEKLDTKPNEPWPKQQGTQVHRLMKKILGR